MLAACSHDITAPTAAGTYVLIALNGSPPPCFVDSVGLNSATSAGDWVYSDVITVRTDSTWSEVELDSLFTPAGGRIGKAYTGNGTWSANGGAVTFDVGTGGPIPGAIGGDSLSLTTAQGRWVYRRERGL